MDVRVLLHVRLLVKPLAAVLAGVGPRVAVDEEVCRQCAAALEGLAALVALQFGKALGVTRWVMAILTKPRRALSAST